MEDNEVILSRIQKLLALTTSSNENEAAVAASKAQELLLKYNLSMTQVEGYNAEKTLPIIEQIVGSGNLPDWQSRLAGVVARNNLCSVFTSGSRLVWVGRETNIQVGRYLTDTLMSDLERLATEYWNGILFARKFGFAKGEELTIHGRVWKQGFYFGAIEVISKRLRESKASLAQDGNMSALIVKEDTSVAQYLRDHYNLRYSSGHRNLAQSGFSTGKEAGATVGFKTGVGSGGAAAPKQIR